MMTPPPRSKQLHDRRKKVIARLALRTGTAVMSEPETKAAILATAGQLRMDLIVMGT